MFVREYSDFRQSVASALRATLARLARNLDVTARFASTRAGRSRARFRFRDWLLPWTAAYLLLVLAAFAKLDPLASPFWGNWSDWIARPARFFTDAGLGGWFIIPAVLWLLIASFTDWEHLRRRWRMAYCDWTALAAYLLWCTALSGIVVNLLKQVFGRARPRHFQELGAFHFSPLSLDSGFLSFPSGHATTLGAATMLLILLARQHRWLILAFGFWLASTRVFVGSHYPSDVIAGFGFGAMFAYVGAILFARMGFIFRVDRSGILAPKRTFRLLWPLRRQGRYVWEARHTRGTEAAAGSRAGIPLSYPGSGPNARTRPAMSGRAASS